jgi:predicted signal transduction protein with EAL and GGDEF domain
MLSGMSALLFLAMVITVVYGVRTFAKDLYGEMIFFAVLISGICVLNALKFMKLVDGGLNALHMDSNFQLVFYIYMSSLATVLPPSIIWLVLRRLTDDLRDMAARDPMTQLLNRRGLTEALQRYFTSRKAVPAHLLMVDVDHFKRINDTYGHQVGDAVLCQVAEVLGACLLGVCTWLSAYAQPSKIKADHWLLQDGGAISSIDLVVVDSQRMPARRIMARPSATSMRQFSRLA